MKLQGLQKSKVFQGTSWSFLWLLLATEAAPAAEKTGMEVFPSYGGTFLKMIFTLVALILGAIGTGWALKRMGGLRGWKGSSERIIVREKRTLSPKTMLYLIEVDGKELLVAESQLEVRPLTTLDKGVEQSHPPSE